MYFVKVASWIKMLIHKAWHEANSKISYWQMPQRSEQRFFRLRCGLLQKWQTTASQGSQVVPATCPRLASIILPFLYNNNLMKCILIGSKS
jgi:hypothetical protein